MANNYQCLEPMWEDIPGGFVQELQQELATMREYVLKLDETLKGPAERPTKMPVIEKQTKNLASRAPVKDEFSVRRSARTTRQPERYF